MAIISSQTLIFNLPKEFFSSNTKNYLILGIIVLFFAASEVQGIGCVDDCTPPTLGLNQGQDRILVYDGFSLNGQSFDVQYFIQKIPTQTFTVGEPIELALRIYEDSGEENLNYVSLSINPADKNEKIVFLTWKKGLDKNETIDINENLVTNVNVKLIRENDHQILFTILFEFTKPTSKSSLQVETRDHKQNSWTNNFQDAIKVEYESLYVNSESKITHEKSTQKFTETKPKAQPLTKVENEPKVTPLIKIENKPKEGLINSNKETGKNPSIPIIETTIQEISQGGILLPVPFIENTPQMEISWMLMIGGILGGAVVMTVLASRRRYSKNMLVPPSIKTDQKSQLNKVSPKNLKGSNCNFQVTQLPKLELEKKTSYDSKKGSIYLLSWRTKDDYEISCTCGKEKCPKEVKCRWKVVSSKSDAQISIVGSSNDNQKVTVKILYPDFKKTDSSVPWKLIKKILVTCKCHDIQKSEVSHQVTFRLQGIYGTKASAVIEKNHKK